MSSQFTSPIVVTLIVAAVISAFLQDPSDALIIVGIVAVSGLLGFWQERSAADAVAKLLELVRVSTTVMESRPRLPWRKSFRVTSLSWRRDR